MPKLVWDKVGERRFESGIDKGVLYTTDGSGVAWNGLTSVKENASGGEIKSFYLDGLRYLNTTARQEFDGTIEAFTYPDVFGIHDGTLTLSSGLIALQQRRKPFALSYRTRVGNDVDGQEHGYKLHIVYNVTAAPSEKTYSSLGDSVQPIAFSWEFSTIPKKPKSVTPVAPLAHVIIDSTKTNNGLLRFLEERLYGSTRRTAQLVSLDELFYLFENPQYVFSIFVDRTKGLSQLVSEYDETGDLIGDEDLGLYRSLSESRLTQTNKAGLYTLAPLNMVLTEDLSDPGTYLKTDASIVEDSTDPGTYLTTSAGLYEDKTDPGTYLNGV